MMWALDVARSTMAATRRASVDLDVFDLASRSRCKLRQRATTSEALVRRDEFIDQLRSGDVAHPTPRFAGSRNRADEQCVLQVPESRAARPVRRRTGSRPLPVPPTAPAGPGEPHPPGTPPTLESACGHADLPGDPSTTLGRGRIHAASRSAGATTGDRTPSGRAMI